MTERERPLFGPFTAFDVRPVATPANRRPVRSSAIPSHVGYGSVVGSHCVLYVDVAIGLDCRLGDHVIIREGSTIGDRCVIGTNVDVQFDCRIGNDVRIMNGSHIAGGTEIGDGTFIGPGVVTANDLTVDPRDYKFPAAGLTPSRIGCNVFIGMAVVILPGVTIGDGARIGAAAVVARNVPAGGLVLPALTRTLAA